MAIELKYAAPEQALAALREAYKNSEGAEVLRLAAKLRFHMDAGDFTATQVRNAFGLSTSQWATLRAKLNSNASAHEATKNARGE